MPFMGPGDACEGIGHWMGEAFSIMPDDMNVADENGEVWNVKVFGFFKYGLLE